ncbi:MAG: sugar phosphate nucleotidyltransferase [Promethearchaeota archaeon]
MKDISIIILIGGPALRMNPLSLNKNKCMISFLGKPLLFYLIRELKSNGFSNFICTSEGFNGEVKNYFSNKKEIDIKMEYFTNIGVFGTASIVKSIITSIENTISDPFIVIYGDSLLKVDYNKMIEFHKEKKSFCTILYHQPNFEHFQYEYHDKNMKLPNQGPRTNYGVLDIAESNQVIRIEEKPLLSNIKLFKSPVANAAVYLLDKRITDFISDMDGIDFALDVFPQILNRNIPCYGFNIENGYRYDIGTISNYYNIQMDIIKKKIDFDIHYSLIRDQLWIGKDLNLGSSIKMNIPILIGNNSKLCDYCIISSSIIGNDVFIGKEVKIMNSIVLDGAVIGDHAIIVNSIIGENTNILPFENISPGTVINGYNKKNFQFLIN